MRAAFATWDEHIAPVFDVSRELRLIDAEAGRIAAERHESLPADLPPLDRARRLADLGVDVLVCGAISRPLQAQVAALGLAVEAFVAGETAAVVQAWLAGALRQDRFTMPGCCGRARRGASRGAGRRSGGDAMNGPGSGRGGRGGGMGAGRGGGRGQGPGAGGAGRGGGPLAGGTGGHCVCPSCGHREAHRRGEPCQQRTCPQCAAAMTREG